MKICRSSIRIFIEVSAKKQLKIQFLGWCFDVLNFRRVKKSYLIRPLLKNSNFLWEMLFFVLNMIAKNREKVQHLGHFFRLTLEKKLWFGMARSKNQNKSRLSRNATKLYRYLYKNTHRWYWKFHNIPNKFRFFFYFSIAILRVSGEKIKKNKIRSTTDFQKLNFLESPPMGSPR